MCTLLIKLFNKTIKYDILSIRKKSDNMLNLLKKIFSKSEEFELPSNMSPKYEEALLKKYGKSDILNKNISLLIIADTHGTLNEEQFYEYIKNKNYDVCILVGDNTNRDLEIILNYIDKNKLYGLKGNHDYEYLKNNNIQDINGIIIDINGVKILGMEGSFKYKPVSFPSFTQEESIAFLEGKEKVDILVSHDKKFDYTKLGDPAHQGLIGITDYLFKNNIPIHIHGHIHEPYKKEMINGTIEYSVFGYELIEINKNNSE
jgi:predicted phosphodiesterase